MADPESLLLRARGDFHVHPEMMPDGAVGLCGCGRWLYPNIEGGKQVSVSHTAQDECHHMALWGGQHYDPCECGGEVP